MLKRDLEQLIVQLSRFTGNNPVTSPLLRSMTYSSLWTNPLPLPHKKDRQLCGANQAFY